VRRELPKGWVKPHLNNLPSAKTENEDFIKPSPLNDETLFLNERITRDRVNYSKKKLKPEECLLKRHI
jgi:hypothetical protein